jgi:hypothetical protein
MAPTIKLLVIGLLACTLASCREHGPTDLCLSGDLGQYRPVEITALSGGAVGCTARYRDLHGQVITARVTQGALPVTDGGAPAKFEKHLLYAGTREGGAWASWTSQGLTIELELPGQKEPQGPVLRAYLLSYPSEVKSEMEATQEAIDQLRAGTHEMPRNAALHLELARKYRKLGNTIMAAQEFQISVSIDPGCAQCYLEMGALYRDLRHWDLSIRALRKAAALAPSDPKPAMLLGDVDYDLHNRDEALSAYRAALRAGLDGPERTRIEERLKLLEDGQFMIEPRPEPKPKPSNPE